MLLIFLRKQQTDICTFFCIFALVTDWTVWIQLTALLLNSKSVIICSCTHYEQTNPVRPSSSTLASLTLRTQTLKYSLPTCLWWVRKYLHCDSHCWNVVASGKRSSCCLLREGRLCGLDSGWSPRFYSGNTTTRSYRITETCLCKMGITQLRCWWHCNHRHEDRALYELTHLPSWVNDEAHADLCAVLTILLQARRLQTSSGTSGTRA